jgi:hypothetical protein
LIFVRSIVWVIFLSALLQFSGLASAQASRRNADLSILDCSSAEHLNLVEKQISESIAPTQSKRVLAHNNRDLIALVRPMKPGTLATVRVWDARSAGKPGLTQARCEASVEGILAMSVISSARRKAQLVLERLEAIERSDAVVMNVDGSHRGDVRQLRDEVRAQAGNTALHVLLRTLRDDIALLSAIERGGAEPKTSGSFTFTLQRSRSATSGSGSGGDPPTEKVFIGSRNLNGVESLTRAAGVVVWIESLYPVGAKIGATARPGDWSSGFNELWRQSCRLTIGACTCAREAVSRLFSIHDLFQIDFSIRAFALAPWGGVSPQGIGTSFLFPTSIRRESSLFSGVYPELQAVADTINAKCEGR